MSKPGNAAEVFDKCAKQYAERHMNVDLYADALDLFCNNIFTKDADILDIACGPGNISMYLLNKMPDLKILGIDLSPNMIALAKINNPTAAFQLMDCRDISMLNKKFDGIICGFCLPYLSKQEAVKLISDASKLLNAGGVLYISTMEDDYSKSGWQTSSGGDQLYMYFHEEDYLIKAMKENSLTVIGLRYQDFPTDDGTKVTDMIIIARK